MKKSVRLWERVSCLAVVAAFAMTSTSGFAGDGGRMPNTSGSKRVMRDMMFKNSTKPQATPKPAKTLKPPKVKDPLTDRKNGKK